MEPIRVVWGAASGPTATASYDAALSQAGVQNYNLLRVSSVVPTGAEVVVAETAPDLGPVGEGLTVVEGRQTVPPGEADLVCAGLGWAQEESGRGILYEAAGTNPDAVQAAVENGLRAGRDLRDWAFLESDHRLVSTTVVPGSYTTAVIIAAYGRSEPVL